MKRGFLAEAHFNQAAIVSSVSPRNPAVQGGEVRRVFALTQFNFIV
jgi:hypothetical protein